MSHSRLIKEASDLMMMGFYVTDKIDTMWTIQFDGPTQSPFYGGHFVVQLTMEKFPFKGPYVKFNTPIYHPNVEVNGLVSPTMLQTMQDKWIPTKRLVTVMQKLRFHMISPDLNLYINYSAYQDFKNGTWFAKAQQLTKQKATK